MVEMALVMPLLIFLCFGVLELGLMFSRYQVILNSARNGARIGSLFRPGCNAATVRGAVISEISISSNQLGMNLTPADIQVTGACQGGQNINVQVTYRHDIGVLSDLLSRSAIVPLRATVMMRNES